MPPGVSLGGTTTMSARSDFLDGGRAIAPLLPPGAAVGLVTGLAASGIGLAPAPTVAMSVVVYSPTVMLTAFGLLEAGAPAVIVVVTSLVVGVRFLLLSLSLSTYLERVATRWRWFLAYFLWTPIYALAVERFESVPETDRRWFYLGLAGPMWVTFQVALLAGLGFGTGLPASLDLGFVVPLAFIALVVRLVDDRPAAAAALVAGGLAVAGGGFPLNTGVIVATIGGTAAGVVVDGLEGGS